MAVLLGIDIGTTATKAVMLDPERGLIAQAERPVTLCSDGSGWAEEHVEDRPAMREALAEIACEHRSHPLHVAHMYRLIQAEVAPDLLHHLATHARGYEDHGRIPGGEVDDEEEEGGDSEDQGDRAQDAPEKVPGHRPTTAGSGRPTNPSR